MGLLLKTIIALFISVIVLSCSLLLAGQKTQTVRSPVISPPGGTFGLNERVTVVIRAEPNCRIVYSFTSTMPAPGNGIMVEGNVATLELPPGDSELRAVAVRPNMPQSQPTRAKFIRSGE